MANSKHRLTDAERRQRDRERLQHAAEQLLTSEGWQRWVRVRSQAGLARLSVSNQLLVALARPDTTFVAGFKAWLRLGYCVRKGERATAIIAPLPIKEARCLGPCPSPQTTRRSAVTVQAAAALSRRWAGRAATDPRDAGAGSAASVAGVSNSASRAGNAGVADRLRALSGPPGCRPRANPALPPAPDRPIPRPLCGLGHGPKQRA